LQKEAEILTPQFHAKSPDPAPNIPLPFSRPARLLNTRIYQNKQIRYQKSLNQGGVVVSSPHFKASSIDLANIITVMVARDVVVFLARIIHTDPFQSGFDSQHRQRAKSWIENAGGSIPPYS
jgi:hypothetical protein